MKNILSAYFFLQVPFCSWFSEKAVLRTNSGQTGTDRDNSSQCSCLPCCHVRRKTSILPIFRILCVPFGSLVSLSLFGYGPIPVVIHRLSIQKSKIWNFLSTKTLRKIQVLKHVRFWIFEFRGLILANMPKIQKALKSKILLVPVI
jgi:hypothetical protein